MGAGWPASLNGWFRSLLAGRPDAAPQAGEAAWRQWRQAVAPHDLLPLVYHRLQEADGASRPPRAVMATLQQIHAASMADAICRWRELDAVLVALATAGVRPVVLKGAALAEQLYPGPELRPSADIDLLVRQPEMPAARQALAAEGYRLLRGDRFGDAQWNYDEAHVFGDDREARKYTVELHWSLSPHTAVRQKLPLERLHQRASPIDRRGEGWWGLEAADALAYGALHLVYKHVLAERANLRLIWLYDLHLLAGRIEASQAWERALAAAGEMEARLALAQSLPLAREWFGTIYPATVEDLAQWPPSDTEMALQAVMRGRGGGRMKLHRLRLAGMSNRQRLAYLKRRLLPDRGEMDFAYPQLKSLPAPLAYLLRPLLSLADARNRRR